MINVHTNLPLISPQRCHRSNCDPRNMHVLLPCACENGRCGCCLAILKLALASTDATLLALPLVVLQLKFRILRHHFLSFRKSRWFDNLFV